MFYVEIGRQNFAKALEKEADSVPSARSRLTRLEGNKYKIIRMSLTGNLITLLYSPYSTQMW